MTRALALACITLVLAAPLEVAAQDTRALSVLADPPERPMLSYSALGRQNILSRVDLHEIEIASSDSQTDVFVRLFDTAAAELAQWTTLARGEPMIVSICGMAVMEVESLSPITTGTLYIPNLTFVQADALRSIWHGRATCSSLPPEVFPIAP